MSPLELVQVELFESETIVARGRKKTSFLLRFNDTWISAGEHPNAQVERLSAGPGTVWERRITVALPVGAAVCRVVSVPRPEPRRSALEYLTREHTGPRLLTRRTELQVGARGALVADADKPAPGRRSR